MSRIIVFNLDGSSAGDRGAGDGGVAAPSGGGAGTAGDAGAHSFSVTLKTAGTQAIRARDTVTSTMTKAVGQAPAPTPTDPSGW